MIPRIGIIGLGGFAGAHHDELLELERKGKCRVICTCDPHPEAFADRQAILDFEGRGVRVFDDYRAMLDECAEELDIVSIPAPPNLHAEMHLACVERGIAVYLEKPPTLDFRELETMIEAETRVEKLTNVGFNYAAEESRLSLKRRLLAGEFGQVKRVCFRGMWPRSDAYFARAPWAGRLRVNGKIVIDSCMGNAMAHFVHASLMWGSTDELLQWAIPESVESELYRAHKIESTDTVFVKAMLRDGPELRLALTHSYIGGNTQLERIVCDDAVIDYDIGGDCTIQTKSGVESYKTRSLSLAEHLSAYIDYCNGAAPRPMTRLIDCRPFVWVNNLAYIASGSINTVPAEFTTRSSEDPSGFIAIHSITATMDRFLEDGTFPSQQGLKWGHAGGCARLADLPRLDCVVDRMIEESKEI